MLKKDLIIVGALAVLFLFLIWLNWSWVTSNSACAQVITTAVLVLITVFYALGANRMAESMKKTEEAQKALLKIKADILTTLIQWDGVKSLSRIARDTNHTEEEIKTVIPDLMGPNGPIIFHGFHGGEPHFRMPHEWDSWGPAQRQKVRADLVTLLLHEGPKNIDEIVGRTGHSEATINNHLPDLLSPRGPIISTVVGGVRLYNIETTGNPAP